MTNDKFIEISPEKLQAMMDFMKSCENRHFPIVGLLRIGI